MYFVFHKAAKNLVVEPPMTVNLSLIPLLTDFFPCLTVTTRPLDTTFFFFFFFFKKKKKDVFSGLDVQKTLDVLQLQFLTMLAEFGDARGDSTGPVLDGLFMPVGMRKTVEEPRVQFLDKGLTCLCGARKVPGLDVQKTAEDSFAAGPALQLSLFQDTSDWPPFVLFVHSRRRPEKWTRTRKAGSRGSVTPDPSFLIMCCVWESLSQDDGGGLLHGAARARHWQTL